MRALGEGARLRAHYFKTDASRLPILAPPDLVTNEVRIGTALATSSGFSPSFWKADAAPANPLAIPAACDKAPAVPTAPLVADGAPIAGAAPSNMSMPGTALDRLENSSALSRDFATPNSAPAA